MPVRLLCSVGYTYSSLPNLIRKDKEPLPLREFLNRSVYLQAVVWKGRLMHAQ